jgi:hypothetical protein
MIMMLIVAIWLTFAAVLAWNHMRGGNSPYVYVVSGFSIAVLIIDAITHSA